MTWKRAGLMMSLMLALAGCGEEVPEAEPLVRPVRYERIRATSTQQRATFVGVAKAGVESRLSFRVQGTVEEVRAEVGDRVQRGQVLAVLDPTDYELKVEEAEAALAQAVAAGRRSDADYERTRALYENNNASKSELDAARATAESTDAQVEAGQKQLEQAKRQLGYTRLKAPVTGSIAQVAIEVNENVTAGSAVFLLTSGSHPEVRVAVPEVLIASLERGLEARVAFDAIDGEPFAGTVTEVAGAAINAPTFEVTVRVDLPTDEIRSGMAADVTFILGSEQSADAIFLNPVAVGEDHHGNFVYVIEPGEADLGTAHRREVRVGVMDQRGLRVEGVSEGELVATAGVRRLVDGTTVRLLEGESETAR